MPDDLRTMASEWEVFWEYVKPEGCSPDQENDMKLSFFAGAYSLLGIMMTIPQDVSIDGGANILEGLKQECEAFHRNNTMAYTNKGVMPPIKM